MNPLNIFNFVSLGISNFYKLNNCPGSGNSFTRLTDVELITYTLHYWNLRRPGNGETTTDRKVVVPIFNHKWIDVGVDSGIGWPHEKFFTGFTRDLNPNAPFKVRIERRKGQPETEAPMVRTHLPLEYVLNNGVKMEEANYVNVICYHKDALLENGGERSCDTDWEIITIICSPIENEPMAPSTMARNQLELPGGTKSEYSGLEYAHAINYWSGRVRVIDENSH